MCGIIFGNYKEGRKANKSIMKRYYKQSTRGKEGYGYVTMKDGKVKDVVHTTGEMEIKDKLMVDNSPMVLFHHRRPTSTPNIPECAHPIFVSHESLNYDYLVVHNGVIQNAKTLRTDFEKEGFIYTTVVEKMYRAKSSGTEYSQEEQFNDSESFAIDVVKNIERGGDDMKSTGSIAFVAVQFEKDSLEVEGIYYGRNQSNPLKLDKTKDAFVLASEGNGIDVPINKLFCYDPKTDTITSETLILGPVTPVHTPTPTPSVNRGVETTVLPPDYHYANSNKNIDKPPFGFVAGGTTTRTSHSHISHSSRNPMDIVKESSHEQIIRGNRELSQSYSRIKEVKGSEMEYKTMTLEMSDLRKKTILFKIMDSKLFKTNIDIFQLHVLTNEEWIKYENLINDIQQFIMLRNTLRVDGEEKNEKDIRDVNSELKKLHMELKKFSDEINRRIDEKF